MSSLARRSLRTTAAVAGIAAAGVGLAGPAFAAPAPEAPPQDGAAPAAPDAAGSAPNVVGDLRPAPGSADLPKLFTIDDTRVYTADQGRPALPAADELPSHQLPSAADLVNVERADRTVGSDVEYQASAPEHRGSAMQELDAASMFDGLGEVTGATAGNEVHA